MAIPAPWPLYFRDNLTFGDLDHPVAICSLWMKQARLAESLSPDSFSILGNLYSKDGLNYLLRNVLAHPTIRAIILCGPDLTQSGAALVALMRDGDRLGASRGGTMARKSNPRSHAKRLTISVRMSGCSICAVSTIRPRSVMR